MPKIFMNARDPVSCYSHFIGVLLSCLGIFIMTIKICNTTFNFAQIMGILFCLSLIGLYSASSIYHYSHASESVIKKLRKLDHSMIYVLIAGSYTPLLYNIIEFPKNIVFISAIWFIALVGIVMKLCWIDSPRWLSTGLYILMGWFIAIDFSALKELSLAAMALLISGGLLYTIGGIIYAIKKPNISTMFGFHEIFHIFVIMGSICHYLMVFWFLI